MAKTAWATIRDSILQRLSRERGLSLLDEIDNYTCNCDPGSAPDHEVAALRGEIYEMLGDAVLAERWYRESYTHAPDATYAKYVAAYVLGDYLRDVSYLLCAVRQSLLHGAMSCGEALVRILDLVSFEQLSKDDRQMIIDAIEMSWRSLRINLPIPHSIRAASQVILEIESEPISGNDGS